jgi:hypothetical protein
MSKPARVRKPPIPLPLDAVPGTVLRKNYQWRVLVGDTEYSVTDTDAWNFDIENNLPVFVILPPGNDTAEPCKIVRKKNNKRYVTI